MSAFFRGRSAFCRILPFFGRSSGAGRLHLNNVSPKITLKCQPAFSLKRNCSTNIENARPTNQHTPRPSLASLPGNVDDALNMIDREVRRVGRIRKDVVMKTYQLLQKSGHVTEHQSLLILRCFGSVMVDEHPEVRTKQAEEVWSGLKELGVKYGVKHYNALLGIYLQNEYKFSPSEFLGKMELEGIAPMRLTYQRLVAGYCQSGDIAGASRVLEHMKTSNLPINETVFNSLIVGHMRAGDEESATGILKIMRESGVPPSGDTYTTLMIEFGRKGDIENIEKISAEAIESQVAIYPSNHLDVVQVLCSSGYSQHFDKVLDLCPKSNMAWYNQDCMNAVLQAVARGHDDVAHKLFLSMQHPTLMDEAEKTFGRFLLKAMIKHDRPLERVVSVLNDLTSRGLNTDRLDFIAQWALVYEKPEYALESFDKMVNEGLPLRTHYFWPVFIAYKNAKNAEGIYRAVQTMEQKVSKSFDFLTTLHEYVVPSLLEIGEDIDSIVEKLGSAGIAAGDVNFASMLGLLKSGKAEEVVTFAKGRDVRFYHALLRPYLLDQFKNTRDSDAAVQLLELAQDGAFMSRDFRVTDLATTFLFKVMDMYSGDTDRLEAVIQSMVDKKLGVTESERLTERLTALGVSLKLIEQLVAVKVTVPVIARAERRQPFEQTMLGSKSMEELEALLQESRASDANIRGPLRWLLEKHCLAGNVAKADEIKTELDGLGFIYTPDIIRALMFLATRHKQDLTEALKYKEMLENDFDHFRAYGSEIINLAALYAKQGNVEAAVSSLRDYHAKNQSYMKEKDMAESYVHDDHCIRLIENCQAAGQMEAPVELMKTLFECGYIKTGCYSLLQAYVKGYLDKDDIDGAVQAVTYCNKQYRRTPRVEDIFKRLIEKESPEKLQEVMDIASSSLGEMQALHHLFFSFVECGKESQARRILETPGMRAMMDVIDSYGNQLINRKKIKELESLVNVTKGLFSLDREHLLFLLIKGYCVENDMDKALNVLSVMEEENLNPRGRTLRYLGKTLMSKGKEVPFEIPDIPPMTSQSIQEKPRQRPDVNQPNLPIRTNLTPTEKEVVQQLSSGGIGAIRDVKALKESIGGSFRLEFINEIARVLHQTKKNRALQFLLYDLAEIGEVETLEQLESSNSNIYRGVSTELALSRAYLEVGAPEKLLDKMTANKMNLGKYIAPLVCRKFSEKYPTMFSQVEELILSAGDEGKLAVVSNLWSHYYATEQLDKATELLQRYPGLSNVLRIAGPCGAAKNQNREDLLQYFIDEVSKNNRSNKAFAYSYLLGLKGQQNDWHGALGVLEKVKNDGFTFDDLRPAPLAELESLLVANEQTVPWQVGKYGQVKRQQSSDSSSSSSSDSDSDTSAEPSVGL
ncbi:leucine-rich PPR motif-containing protein, mitochondrial-like [Lineus longissimus]|uniref:leucine-rich PPR motif-containing protein, mitochondrial-like n=1 Tax=Lineus longissimus TaxID=88925 RepID=UPI002B4CC659